MKLFNRGRFAFFVLLAAPALAQERFISVEDQQRLLEFKGPGQPPRLPACPAGEDVPLAVTFAQDGRVQGQPRLWKRTRKGWLHTATSSQAISDAVAYIKKATLRLAGKKPIHTVVRIPCASQ